MGRTGQWIYHQIVEEPEARCTSENFPANHHEQEKVGEEGHSIPVSGCNGPLVNASAAVASATTTVNTSSTNEEGTVPP